MSFAGIPAWTENGYSISGQEGAASGRIASISLMAFQAMYPTKIQIDVGGRAVSLF
jgi:hypothetical protein